MVTRTANKPASNQTVIVQPGNLTGQIMAAASKSSMQRACAAALLHQGHTRLVNPGNSHDDLAALEVIQKLGAHISWQNNGDILIESQGVFPVDAVIDCGESGLGIRMFTPIAALSDMPLSLTGRGSLLNRPMDFFDRILPQLGVQIQTNEGKLPFQIQGPLRPASITVDGSLSSQFLTGLLMAYGAAGAKDVSITVTNLKSRPYIDLTLGVMHHFGWNIRHRQYETFFFDGSGKAGKDAIIYQVEGDWSGAAFLLVAGATAGNLIITGLDPKSAQADKAVLDALRQTGCKLVITEKQIHVGATVLQPFVFDAEDCPDLFPPLAALAANAEGISRISGVNRLAHKESNRALSLQSEFAKLGIEIKLDGNEMLIRGGTGIRSAATWSHNDHRIAMACAVAALKADGPVHITDADAINKSYPAFYEHIRSVGAAVLDTNSND
ncbi:MAG TPA: 3-phosphoshikimate 1-carboxyvinyltransferase [Sediminibacterium sp.]|nr:3-phosphoshikimate 1-carboxyvinyltransferase [Sediminibacterium sp.]